MQSLKEGFAFNMSWIYLRVINPKDQMVMWLRRLGFWLLEQFTKALQCCHRNKMIFPFLQRPLLMHHLKETQIKTIWADNEHRIHQMAVTEQNVAQLADATQEATRTHEWHRCWSCNCYQGQATCYFVGIILIQEKLLSGCEDLSSAWARTFVDELQHWQLKQRKSLVQAAEDARASADTASRKKHLLQEQTKTRTFSLSRGQPTSGKEKLMASGSSQNQNNAKKGADHLGKITRVQCMCKTCAHCSRGSKTSRKSCRRRYDWRNPTIRVEFMAPLGFRYKKLMHTSKVLGDAGGSNVFRCNKLIKCKNICNFFAFLFYCVARFECYRIPKRSQSTLLKVIYL